MDLISNFSDISIIKRNLETARNFSKKNSKDRFELMLLLVSLIFLLIITPILLISINYVPIELYLLFPLSYIPWMGLICSVYAFILSQYFPIDKYYSDNSELSVFNILIHNILSFAILLCIIYLIFLIYTTVPVLGSDPLIMEVNPSLIDNNVDNNFMLQTSGYSKFTVRGDVQDTKTCVETCQVRLENNDINTIEIHSNWLNLQYGKYNFNNLDKAIKRGTGWRLPDYLGYSIITEDEYLTGSYKSVTGITEVKRWGSTQWISMYGLFKGADNLRITANDTAKISRVEKMDSAFENVQSIRSDNINNWDTSNVRSMNGLFYNTSNFNNGCRFNLPCNKLSWDTSNVRGMNGLFYNTSFNQDISDWDTSNVTEIRYMFRGNSEFNQSLNNWNTSSVEDMGRAFAHTHKFNQSLNNWNTRNVTNMESMFTNSKFNRSISDWNTSNVKYMSTMFRGNSEFNQSLNNWNTSNLTYTLGMFNGADNFNSSLNNWNTSNVKYMGWMFNNTSFNRSINSWNTSNVTIMSYMFANSNFNRSINSWNTSNVEDMDRMFCNASNFNQDISDWDTSNVEDMDKMFYNASNFNQDINNWDVNQFSTYMMLSNTRLNKSQYNEDKWNVAFIEPESSTTDNVICY